MPIKQINNTGYAPVKIFDLFNRSNASGCTDVLNDDITSKINHDWIFYITQNADCVYSPNHTFTTNVITAYIFDNFKNRVLLDDYADAFCGWDESTDFESFVEMVKCSIEKMLIANDERYDKLYYSMIAEFNPLWNVDGETITERVLHQTGTDENAKTGSDEIQTNRDISENETISDDTTNTGTDTTAKSGSDTTAKTGTETLGRTGSDTTTTSNTTYDESTFYDGTKNVTTNGTTDTTTHNTQDVTDYNTSETITHNTSTENDIGREKAIDDDTTQSSTYNSKDTNTKNLTDTETISEVRRGNIGVTTTTKLLTEFREFANFSFIDIVAKDIVNTISYMVY